jgi:GH24 family phage-related lysozyme (muramidase)
MRLLLICLLFPFTLFGQNWRGAITESIRGAGKNLQSISDKISDNKGASIEQVGIADSGGYVLLTVRVRIVEGVDIPGLTYRPLFSFASGPVVGPRLRKVALPPMPPLIVELDTIPPLPTSAVLQFITQTVPFVAKNRLRLPPAPDLVLQQDPLDLYPVLAFAATPAPPGQLESVPLPPMPDLVLEQVPLRLIPVAEMAISMELQKVMGSVALPPMPEVVYFPDPVSLLPHLNFATVHQFQVVLDTVVVPVFEEKRTPVAEMHLSDEGYTLLEKLEGFSPELYALGDGGFTIGFGFFVPYSESRKWSKGVTWEDAERLIREKVPAYEDQVKKYINVDLTQAEFDALTMMAYNLGGFSKATSIVNDINGDEGFDKLQRDWMRFVHSKAPGVTKGLMNRRRDEMKVRGEWDYQPERKIQIYKNRR